MHAIETWHSSSYLKPPAAGELHLWRIDLDEPGSNLRNILSGDEKERAQHFIDPQDRARFVRTRGALRMILARYLEQEPRGLVFGYGPQGKPFVESPTTALSFNLTHMDQLALLVFTWDCAIGIDVEQIRERVNALAIARRLFPADAIRELDQLGDGERSEAFYRHWTALEARLKAQGKGIFSGPQDDPGFDIHHFVPEAGWIAAIAMDRTVPPPEQWVSWRFQPRQKPA